MSEKRSAAGTAFNFRMAAVTRSPWLRQRNAQKCSRSKSGDYTLPCVECLAGRAFCVVRRSKANPWTTKDTKYHEGMQPEFPCDSVAFARNGAPGLLVEVQLDPADSVLLANLYPIRVLSDDVSGELCDAGLCAHLFDGGHGVGEFERKAIVCDLHIELQLVPRRTERNDFGA